MTKMNFFLVSIIAMNFVVHGAEAFSDDDYDELDLVQTSSEVSEETSSSSSFFPPPSPNRRLAEKKAKLTCNKYPQICRSKRSPGPDCCKKQCVNVMTDRLNCGMCGYKCRKNEACCGGRCVNLLNDERNCGSCKKRCSKGDICVYGLCNYA